eukprot:1158122-Pelagomonas_calceolata.AAC.21
MIPNTELTCMCTAGMFWTPMAKRLPYAQLTLMGTCWNVWKTIAFSRLLRPLNRKLEEVEASREKQMWALPVSICCSMPPAKQSKGLLMKSCWRSRNWVRS